MAEPVRKMPADWEMEAESLSADPFRYGWRWRSVRLPGGEVTEQQIPLTAEDLLDPQLGDEVTQSGPHSKWFVRLGYLLEEHYESRDDVLVCCDMKMLWGIPGLKEPSPDIAIVQGIREKEAERSSFDVLKEGVRPCLIVELVSSLDKDVRLNDYDHKVEIYRRAGIPEYFIVDPPTHFTRGRLLLTAYRLGPDGTYRRVEPDSEDRLLSETTGLLFGIEEDGKTLLLVDSKTGVNVLDSAKERIREAEAENARLRAEIERLKNR